MDIAHRMEQLPHLILAGAHNPGIRMARSGYAKPSRQVEVAFPVAVPNEDATGSFPDNRPGTVRIDERNVPGFIPAKQIKRLPGVGACHRANRASGIFQTARVSGFQITLCI